MRLLYISLIAPTGSNQVASIQPTCHSFNLVNAINTRLPMRLHLPLPLLPMSQPTTNRTVCQPNSFLDYCLERGKKRKIKITKYHRTMDEPQQIVSTRKLYCLQYHDLNTSSVLAKVSTMNKCNKLPPLCTKAWSSLVQTWTTQRFLSPAKHRVLVKTFFIVNADTKLSVCLVLILT